MLWQSGINYLLYTDEELGLQKTPVTFHRHHIQKTIWTITEKLGE